MNTPMTPSSIDDDSRMRDFLARHGGALGAGPRRGETVKGMEGWSEVYAVDGYVLRCDWVKQGERTEMRYEERRPHRSNEPGGQPDKDVVQASDVAEDGRA